MAGAGHAPLAIILWLIWVRHGLKVFVEDNRLGFGPSAHLRAGGFPLLVRAPEIVLEAAENGGGAQPEDVDPGIAGFGDEVARDREPALPPPPGHDEVAGITLDGYNDLVCDVAVDVAHGGFFHGGPPLLVGWTAPVG
jgi:hypothetical protein